MGREGGRLEEIMYWWRLDHGLSDGVQSIQLLCRWSKAASRPTEGSWEARSATANDDVREDGFVRTIEDDILEP